jgi:ligand-binding sensor domain-containing protein
MRIRWLISLLVWVSCFQATALCQSPGYLQETFGSRNGLLSSKIYALAQTRDRMLWIGTELGASRYDGYSFTNFQYTADNESIGRVLCIAQDSAGGVWIGGDKGLFYESGGELRRIKLQSRPTLAVETMITDAAGNVWLGELNALYKLPPTITRAIAQQQITTINVLPHANFNMRVFGLATDEQQTVYASSFDGVFKLNGQSHTYDTVWLNPVPDKFVRSVAVLSPDSIYWNRYDDHPEQLIRGKKHVYYSHDYLGRIVFTHRNRVYALTTSGVSLITRDEIVPLVSHTAITNNAFTALIDAEENIWIGTWEGLLKFRKSAFQQFQLQDDTHTEVFSMLEKKNGELLFGSNRGKVFTRKDNRIVPHTAIPALFTHAEVMCMHEAADGSIWAGSGYQGVSQLKNNKVKSWLGDSLLKDNNCEALYPAGDGKLMACTEQGVTVIDPLAASPLIVYYAFEKKYTRYPELFGCFQTGNSGYWFYGSQGLFGLKNNMLIDDSISGMPVKSLYINRIVSDKKGNIWVATLGKGLLKCVLENGRLVMKSQYDSKKGLPSDNALSVLVDKNDNVWLGDYMSLSLIIRADGGEQLISFNEKDGLFSSYYQSLKLEQQRDGTAWALTSMGLLSFHPDSIGRNSLPPVLLMDYIRVNYLIRITHPNFITRLFVLPIRRKSGMLTG